jgi:hypothetical protein
VEVSVNCLLVQRNDDGSIDMIAPGMKKPIHVSAEDLRRIYEETYREASRKVLGVELKP